MSMPKMQMVSSTFWGDRKVRQMGEPAHTLAIYLLTNAERQSEGFYALPVALALDQLKWDRATLELAADELRDLDFALYDLDAEAVFIVKALKFHPPRGPKQITAAVRSLGGTDAPYLFWQFLNAADRYAPTFAAAVRARYSIPDKSEPEGGSPHG